MKVILNDSWCDVCRENVPNRVISIEGRGSSSIQIYPRCIEKADGMIAPYDLYSNPDLIQEIEDEKVFLAQTST